MNAKKIFWAIGPFLIACLLTVLLLFPPLKGGRTPSQASIKKAAASMSINVIKGNVIKNEAMASGEYLPFFGSSELSRINPFHPSVLAQKYERSYTPFLLGAPGTQSLSHFLMLQSMSESLKNKKIVFIISPQWFVKNGVTDSMFSLYYSPLQTYQWLLKEEPTTADKQAVAERLLTFSSIRSNTRLFRLLTQIAAGESLNKQDIKIVKSQFKLLQQEDRLFYQLDPTSKEKKITRAANQLPFTYNVSDLENLATKIGTAKTKTNAYQITDSFYTKRIAPVEHDLKNSQTAFNYITSKEYVDFQLVLNELAKNQTQALFVIPPVNKKWSDYTGLSEDMLNQFSQKITTQLRSQGFTNIADYTYKRDVPYFMEDTIHLGWHGWLQLDRDLQHFLTDQTLASYQIDNDRFLKQE